MAQPSGIRRMARWTAAGLCAAILAAWAVSIHTQVNYVSPGQRLDVRAYDGGLNIFWCLPAPVTSVQPGWESIRIQRPAFPWDRLIRWPRPGFSYFMTMDRQHASQRRYFILPYWCLLLAAAIPTGGLFYRNRPVRPGHCPTCRYDLTGNTSGVCS